MPYQLQPFDLASSFLAAQQARQNQQAVQLNELRLDEARRKGLETSALPDARMRALGGDAKMLASIAPDEYAAQLQMRQTQQQNQLKQAEAAKAAAAAKFDANRRGADALSQGLAAAANNPALYSQVRQSLIQARSAGAIDFNDAMLPEVAPEAMPQVLPQLVQQAQTQRQLFADPQAQQKLMEQYLTDTAREVYQQAGLRRGDVGYEEEYRKLRATEEAQKLERAKAGGVRVNVGPDGQQSIGLTTAQQNAVQGELRESQELLMDLDDLRALGDPKQWLGLGTRIKNATLGAVAAIDPSVLSDEQKSQLSNARQAKEILSKIFNKVRKDVTGAGAAVAELRALQDSVLNKDLSVVDYKASYARLYTLTQRSIAIKEKLLTEGFQIGSTSYGKRFEEEWKRAAQRERNAAANPANAQAVRNLEGPLAPVDMTGQQAGASPAAPQRREPPAQVSGANQTDDTVARALASVQRNAGKVDPGVAIERLVKSGKLTVAQGQEVLRLYQAAGMDAALQAGGQ